MNPIDNSIEDTVLGRIPHEIIFLTIILTIPTGLLFGLIPGFLFLAGGLVSAGGFLWLKRTVLRMSWDNKKKSLPAMAGLYVLRLILILGLFFIIIHFFSKGILAFAAGFSTVILVFLYEAGVAFSKLRQWKS